MKKLLVALFFVFLFATIANASTPSVWYKAHVEKIGWQGWYSDAEIAGTVGKSLRMEAIIIKLSDMPGNAKIKYSTHIQDHGWLP